MLRELQKLLRDGRRHGASASPSPSLAAGQPESVEPDGGSLAAECDEPIDAPLSAALLAQLNAVQHIHPRLYESLRKLDSAQLAAVLCEDAAALVRAPVGSGKTTVLVHKLLYLHYVKAVPLREMALLTFTNRAAGEFRARIEALAEQALSDDDFWLTGTFHSVARTLLARVLPVEKLGYQRDFKVLDEEELAPILESVISRHRLRVGRRQTLRKRLRALGKEAAASGDLGRLTALLLAEKRAQNAMDFDDLIDHATALLANAAKEMGQPALVPPRYILVDEMQDCEPRELAFLHALRGPGTHFFGVGDPHQAIYGFRGSAPEVFTRAESELGCRAYALPVNYRSTRTIVDGARAVLGLQKAAGGALRAVRGSGARIVIRRHHDPLSEALYLAERLSRLHAEGIGWGELAVLYRLRAQAEPIREALRSRDIPCADSDDPRPDAVCLLTLHAGKGMEFRQVFLSGINDGLLPLGHGFDTASDAEDRRLLFVGLTRARDGVEISYHTRPQELGATGEPSPFLLRLPAALVDWQDAPAAVPAAAPAPVASPAPAEPAPAVSAPPASSPWQPGQRVRHPRYGIGVVSGVSEDSVDCNFGKLGPRSFPLALCPLTPCSDP